MTVATQTTQTPSRQFVYRRAKPYSSAAFKFKTALADYAVKRLLPRLQARTAGYPDSNIYTGLNVRLTDNAIYLEAILTNTTEWGGFGFDFARLSRAKNGLYNLAVRRVEDWSKAEQETVAAASNYFMETVICPRARDWVGIARAKTFEECVELLLEEPTF
jgi:hypothetical protein